MKLIARGIEHLWTRILAANAMADSRPLLLSYDVHPSPEGPVLIEVNTNAGGVLTAIQAARQGNDCCADWQQGMLEDKLLALFRRDLLGDDANMTGVVAIVDDQLASQPLLAEMLAIADLLRPFAREVRVVDEAELSFGDGRLQHAGVPVDRIYWRSTDFLLTAPEHAPVRRAVSEGSTILAPSPQAYEAIADKRRFHRMVETRRTRAGRSDRAVVSHRRDGPDARTFGSRVVRRTQRVGVQARVRLRQPRRVRR